MFNYVSVVLQTWAVSFLRRSHPGKGGTETYAVMELRLDAI